MIQKILNNLRDSYVRSYPNERLAMISIVFIVILIALALLIFAPSIFLFAMAVLTIVAAIVVALYGARELLDRWLGVDD